MDQKESRFSFDSRLYNGSPDREPCPESMDIPAFIKRLDSLYNRGLEKAAGEQLRSGLEETRRIGDWRGELSILSELLGYCRRSGERERAMDAVRDALEIIRTHRMGTTVSGATVLLNAATTLKCFGRAEDSLPLFEHVSRVYSENLDPSDCRLAGLYNNMALSLEDTGQYDAAEKYFRAALKITEGSESSRNESAVTLCNLAELYDKKDPEDERIGECMERAFEYLTGPGSLPDGRNAFAVSKCAPSFDYFGYFLYSKLLKERAEKIYELSR
ncbi:MAG: tetratricopeptide repeat protein [Candidatus Limivicinus sp.]|jgi:tetratricopeptide (TPR) repeat protein